MVVTSENQVSTMLIGDGIIFLSIRGQSVQVFG